MLHTVWAFEWDCHSTLHFWPEHVRQEIENNPESVNLQFFTDSLVFSREEIKIIILGWGVYNVFFFIELSSFRIVVNYMPIANLRLCSIWIFYLFVTFGNSFVYISLSFFLLYAGHSHLFSKFLHFRLSHC